MKKATDLVCIIDDDGSVLRALGRMISSFGYPIQLFQSAREYLDGPHIEQPTCLVLDITMPEMDGFESKRANNIHLST